MVEVVVDRRWFLTGVGEDDEVEVELGIGFTGEKVQSGALDASAEVENVMLSHPLCSRWVRFFGGARQTLANAVAESGEKWDQDLERLSVSRRDEGVRKSAGLCAERLGRVGRIIRREQIGDCRTQRLG